MSKAARQGPAPTPAEPAATASFAGQRLFAVQSKPTVGAPDDRYEREADQVAEQVMRTPILDGGRAVYSPPTPPRIQRLCKECEEELQRAPSSPEPAADSDITTELHTDIAALRGGGQALASTARDFFEPRFNHDFSRVRVHTDSRAAHTAAAINARAFTFGRNIAFGAGEYSPGTAAGKQLLAHELAHVVQQGAAANPGGPASVVTRSPLVIRRTVPVNTPRPQERVTEEEAKQLGRAGVARKIKIGAVDDPAERQADIWAEQVMRMSEPVGDHAATSAPRVSRVVVADSVVRRYTRVNTVYLWDLYDAAGRNSAAITDVQLRTTIEYEDYTRADLIWRFSDTVALGATRRSLALFDTGVRGRRPNYIRAGGEARAAAQGLSTITLDELGFAGDHVITRIPGGFGGTPGAAIDSPDGSAPVWTSGGVRLPVAYTVGTAPAMFARFTVTPSISPAIPNVRLRALSGSTVIGEASGLTITATTVENTGVGTGWVTGIGGGSAIPGTGSLAWQPLVPVRFEVSADGGTVWFNAGTALVEVISTLAAPIPPGGVLREDVLRTATLIAVGAGAPADGLRAWVQAGVTYDPSVAMPGSFATSDAVLAAFTTPHQCDSQAYLMRYLARSIGLAADVQYFWRGASGESWHFIKSGGAYWPGSWWWGPTFQCDRPAEDFAVANPHFTFHAFTEIGGVLHDPTYNRVGLPAILESTPGSSNQLDSRAAFLASPSRRKIWFCAH